MEVILTHEQADFDALAALLGMHLLHDHALPILPRRMNRNGREFTTLYAKELPFVDPRELPSLPIDKVFLVDTQSLVTLKGMSAHTRVQVLDHHQARPDLPPDWEISLEKTGAITTTLVEEIQKRDLRLNLIQASLLLLGIYEDTGSLTYASTTPRDAHATAFLLEQGANLSLVGDFLNPPLSQDQRRLYDQLLSASETVPIHGQTIVVACAEARDLKEEISSIAHKMRDLLDPDALFLLVRTGEGLRMVARANSDRINVADVAAHFGGGGHDRAAAALIRDPEGEAAPLPVEEVCRELIQLLPQYVRPSITVGQIMSRHPRLLAPETPAEEAAQLMQRYGYEGYPVVKDGKVIGLLTRRAVDRSITHKLNLPAASLMEAGEVTVHPGDSLDYLQSLMTATGWGQVPVVDPEKGEIVGIVTRTDLLKTLANQSLPPSPQNLSSHLEAALPPTRLALLKAVAQKARELRMAVYIVGGFVRDLLLERPSLDFDVVVEGDAIALGRALAAQYGGRVVRHTRFGTTKWHIAEVRPRLARRFSEGEEPDPNDLPESLDLITARIEFYDYPTALPTVENSSIKLDLHRRDFTINTMALRLDGRHYGELYDYWGGSHDLAQKLVRVLHSLSFIDDPTRMLRAVRFEQRFDFRIEQRTLELIDAARSMLRQVSGDRLRHELNLILAEERAPAMLTRLQELGLLSAIHPDLRWEASLAGSLETIRASEPPEDWELPAKLGNAPLRLALAYLCWLSCLTPKQARGVSKRLKLPAILADAVLAASALRQDLPALAGARPSQVAVRVEGVPAPALYAVYLVTSAEDLRECLRQYATRWRHLTAHVSGHDLQAMGLPPGPAYREILGALRVARLDGKVQTPEEERAYLNELLEARKDLLQRP